MAMVRPGDELHNPISGDRIIFRHTAAETHGELFEAERFLPAGGPEQPEHEHPEQESVMVVLAGVARFTVNGEEHTAGEGERLVVPAGVPHRVCNAGDETLHLRLEYRPALESTERFLLTLFGAAHEGKADSRGAPSLLQISAMIPEYADYIRFTSPPAPTRELVLGPLAAIARLRGYRPSYEERSSWAQPRERSSASRQRESSSSRSSSPIAGS